ncbi:phosphate transport system permease protein [Microbacterium trichothecenolyticum]|uniref:phosphate ABC transporter permease PstA n=1 Tax=Microbacterium trichothecenolyticum TaxID=69370 RepID=UPI0028648D7B|nr:phosphate ABC transporter permease PstA [Microbacterium trichothecenolyticum]MDR7182989.1 phosphate transport system permease protein [Microbacterium trichothecenolyticum]
MTIALESLDVEARHADSDPGEDVDAEATGPRTHIPDRDDTEIGERRQVRSARLDDRYALLGAAAGALALAGLLFGWIAPLSGFIGFVVVAFLAFLALYALLVSMTADLREVGDRLMTVVLASAGVILFSALLFVVLFAIFRGWDALTHLNFFFQDMRYAGPLDGLDVGGIAHAIVGTLIQIGIALAISIPLGILTALFLNEVGGRFARFVRTIGDAMTALPSIVAGLFIYSALIIGLGLERSGFAAALAITVMMLPIMIRASDVVLRLVAGNLREASYALGSSRWRTVWGVVLPTARSGLVTAIILATARGIGETSPVLLTSGITNVMNANPFDGPMISLPLQVFTFVASPEPSYIARGFGTAAVLMLLVLTLFITARILGGRGPGDLSPRQRRTALARSRQDVIRAAQRAAGERIETSGYAGFGFQRVRKRTTASPPPAASAEAADPRSTTVPPASLTSAPTQEELR